MSRIALVLATVLLLNSSVAMAQNADTIARGKKALESRSFTPTKWTEAAYDDAWKRWTPKPDQKPADYDRAFTKYYGLHPAPFENGRYPMGLRVGAGGKGLVVDCMECHGGSMLGKSYVGLGNASVDLQALYEDMSAGSGLPPKMPLTITNVRGTNEAFALTEFLLTYRNTDFTFRKEQREVKICDTLCEDVPAWWLLKKKETIYRTGSHRAKSVRALMQFMISPPQSLADIQKEEGAFRDIQAYLLSMETPKYPFPINKKLAEEGRTLFTENCARCHGTYGASAKYPNKIIPLKTIGTDPARANNFSSDYYQFYNQTWFAKETAAGFKTTQTAGYQAPPLDGIWATAPYLHNGSAPTLHDVLHSMGRPKLFTRSYATDDAAYDKVKVGWKVDVLRAVPKNLAPIERRKIYDTTQPGRGNGGHTFGDDFSEAERRAVIEYLKTL